MGERIVVVGGGMAGLAAALELAGSHQVTVLEARDRFGGRIFTSQAPGGPPMELGAEFVHGKPPELWKPIGEAQLATHEVPDRHWEPEAGRLVEIKNFWDRITNVTDEIEPSPRDKSFAEFLACLRQPREAEELAREFVEGFHAAPVERASTQAMRLNSESSERLEGQRAFRVNRGFNALVGHMLGACRAKGVELRLGCEVAAINWTVPSMDVRLRAGESARADRVIITLPIGVLRGGALSFTPAPRAKLEAIHALAMGQVAKVVLSFRGRFWPVPNFGFAHPQGKSFATWWADERGDLLTAWAGGPKAAELAGRSEHELIEIALDEAAGLFATPLPKVRELLSAARWHNWSRDPFSLGAYSFVPVDALWAAKELARPEEGRLFFAGEATDLNRQFGTVHGAIASGLRAAHDVQSAR